MTSVEGTNEEVVLFECLRSPFEVKDQIFKSVRLKSTFWDTEDKFVLKDINYIRTECFKYEVSKRWGRLILKLRCETSRVIRKSSNIS
ncbi:MAG: hypothetical protein ACTS4X_01120 [Candidatus Hodgkinia cicadicola]